jgi:predicted RNase H-like HicB family nuclease
MERHPETILVFFPGAPECVTEGSGRAEALANAQDALDTWLGHCMVQGLDLPRPERPRPGEDAVVPSLLVAAKAAVYLV